MQNRSGSETLCFSTTQPNMDVSFQNQLNKSPQIHKNRR